MGNKLSQNKVMDVDKSYKRMGSRYAIRLLYHLTKYQNLEKFSLNLNNNLIDSEGVCGFDLGKLNKLQYLKFSISENIICSIGAESLGKQLKKCKKLSSLDICLSYNQKIGSEGVVKFSECLNELVNLSSISLDFYKIDLTSQGAILLGQKLQSCFNLDNVVLHLGNNMIDYQGCQQLAISLFNCQKLYKLHLGLEHNQIGSQGFQSIGNQLFSCKTVKYLSIQVSDCGIKQEGIIKFCEQIKQNQVLISFRIDLKWNQLQRREMRQMFNRLSKIKRLVLLSIKY
ncbi:kinase domain protein (macronuclear) [Tetrahymena thermophila SB210]|uniref:Kinase domain protein n=1 Tax=Tetrahymena thermophila (strain SB210) TaxID=312017 RepID=W7XDT7_TETTS|nr:kinase domain protein [Tetrahymena thermophila SB210]EWS72026.1 kinase domain protein [Tetrahymena thermophila SB210]|eukprot:XP_012655433.1 kinase domain protein [Tetrahymena thermophila SB210]